MRQNNLRPFAAAMLVAAAAVLAGCSSDGAPGSGKPADAKPVDASKTGTLSGRVLLDGPAPANAQIQMSADPFCIRANQGGAAFESYVVDNGGLGNVFVYIKDGVGSYWVDVPSEPVKLDQSGCRYAPHVLGVRVGQPLDISNSDETMHNVHALAKVNRDFNFGQPIKGKTDRKTFEYPEVMVTLKCDVHSWMNAYVGVVNHPYFAVTANDGSFTIGEIPAGTYAIEAWHEKLGTQTLTVTLAEKGSKNISFTFKSPAASTN